MQQAHDEENPAQFITSTFRPELVNVADAHIGVSQDKKASVVRHLTKHQAANFLMQKAPKQSAAMSRVSFVLVVCAAGVDVCCSVVDVCCCL